MQIKKILVITLSNIGDVILTTPVIRVLKKNFPKSYFVIMCSAKAKDIFLSDPCVNKVIEYNKHIKLLNKLYLALELRKERFDIVVDLRHTLFPLFLGSKYKTSILGRFCKDSSTHKINFHLNKLKELKLNIDLTPELPYIYIPQEVKENIDVLLTDIKFKDASYIVVSPGGRSQSKLWAKEKFLKLCEKIIGRFKCKVLLVGDLKDKIITNWIAQNISSKDEVFDLSGNISLLQLAELLRRAKVLITNDSGALHMGSAVGIPVVAIFGPTNELQYGPVGEKSIAVTDDIDCRPCIYAKCKDFFPCLNNIGVSKVYKEVEKILSF